MRFCFFWRLPPLTVAAAAGAQQLPPDRTSQADARRAFRDADLRVTATEVLVPTLVEKRGGGILYGLKPGDFVLEDNGVPQKIRVQEEMDTAPVALVVAVEQGGVSVLEFDKLAKLGPLLDLFLTDPAARRRWWDSIPSRISFAITRTPATRSTRISSTWSRATAARRFSTR
jgi:hypothetical protein